MMINHDLATFIASPVMIILGTSDNSLAPSIGRALGAFARGDDGVVDLVVSNWQWPKTVANVRANGRLAVTFARPSDYVSYQVKGYAAADPASDEHLAMSVRYVARMSANLEELGLDKRVTAPWFVEKDLVALQLSVQEIFVQTPGAKAGQLIERQT